VICSVVFLGLDLIDKLRDFLSFTKPVSDLTHDTCFPSFWA
jgi:hypothetical protein